MKRGVSDDLLASSSNDHRLSLSLRTHSDARVTVDSLDQLLALMPHHPVGVDLRGACWVQRHHLESAEISFTDGKVLRAHVIDVQNTVLIKVVFADITTTIT